ncbi:hypothetical protein DQ04_03441000 [Trypanosoma grayi]|uniref:hypothetical protein n=1 Tax=Trypanosoma grayi TaxID=71804 RepID=UPI0004F4634A|nr:hypothetical protein DQ04_03441000 [Trypanosoma grayi]KEG10663.1 hypothetical protein DQ04_03441000 [Trypanosoma grayi]
MEKISYPSSASTKKKAPPSFFPTAPESTCSTALSCWRLQSNGARSEACPKRPPSDPRAFEVLSTSSGRNRDQPLLPLPPLPRATGSVLLLNMLSRCMGGKCVRPVLKAGGSSFSLMQPSPAHIFLCVPTPPDYGMSCSLCGARCWMCLEGLHQQMAIALAPRRRKTKPYIWGQPALPQRLGAIRANPKAN